MLSQQLRRCFATIGARLIVHTDPKGSVTRVSLRSDERGAYFELLLPRLSRGVVEIVAVHPRQKRLLLRVSRRSRHMYLLVRGGAPASLRAVKPAEVGAILSGEVTEKAA